MRYFFGSKIEVNKDGGFVRIPFNIWEVCKHREVIKADVVLDNKIIECELLPIERGDYVIHIKSEDVVDVDVNKIHKILLHVNGSLIRVRQSSSPYSLENPIRNVGEGVEIIKQPYEGLCGQAVVAMLAGVTIADVVEVMDRKEWQATMGRMISALNFYGIDHSDIIYYFTNDTEGVTLPECCIIMERMGRFSHYLIHYKGKFYDPSYGVMDDYDMSKLHGYLEIRY